MKNSLIPTAVVDKNGRQTTVHKRRDAPAPSTRLLAGIKPSLGGAPASTKKVQKDSKVLQITFNASEHSVEPSINPANFLARAGMTEGIAPGKGISGWTNMTVGELYSFLRLGITKNEAAFLTRDGATLEQLTNNPEFVAALPGTLAQTRSRERLSVENVVDYLHEQGTPPAKVASLLNNGLRDIHLEKTVIEPQKAVKIFEKMKYQWSSVGADTNAMVTIDALLDGRLPYELMEEGFERTTLTMASDALYPRKRGFGTDSLTDAERAHLQANPEEIVRTVRALNEIKDRRSRDFVKAFRSIREYGYEASVQYNPDLLLMRPGGGEPLGIEGAQKVRGFVDSFSDHMRLSTVTFQDVKATSGYVYPRETRTSADIEYEDIALMQRQGASNEQITKLLESGTISSSQALALVRGDAVPAMVEGWL
jgi:hypothetical protein